MGGEQGKLSLLAGAGPRTVRLRRGFGQLFHQTDRDLRLFFNVAAETADQAGLNGIGRTIPAFRLGLFQQPGETGVGLLFVNDAGERGQLGDPVGFGIDRHERLLVPIQQGCGMFQVSDDSARFAKTLVCSHLTRPDPWIRNRRPRSG